MIIKNEFFISTSTTNALGFSSLIIQPENLQNITGKTIIGKLEHDDYYFDSFNFILFNNITKGRFTIAITIIINFKSDKIVEDSSST